MRCHYCKDSPAAYVAFRHNVGMLFTRRTYTSHSRMCRPCAGRAFWHHQLRNVVLGWWGFISFCLTWWYLASNIVRYIGAVRGIRNDERERTAPGEPRSAAAALRVAPFEVNVAWRLGDGDCPHDIARDLAEAAGVTEQCARLFVSSAESSQHAAH
jgi:hypothetical protein